MSDPSRFDPDVAPSPRPGRAVVLGGSLAGLLAAKVLAAHFAEVVVVDRDPLDVDLQAPRRGVPQGKHTHGLLVSGLQAIDAVVPGFASGVLARGGQHGDVGDRTRWHLGGGSLVRFESGLVGLLASRTLIESEVRRLVARTPGITWLGDRDIIGLTATSSGDRVTGVTVSGRRTPDGISGEQVDVRGDLVVDATGRGSRAPVWLAELGYAAPAESVVPVGITYVTRLFRAREGVLDDLDGEVIGTEPGVSRGGVALRQEGDLWTVTLAGLHGEQPPTDLARFTRYAAELPTPGLGEIAARCEPIGEAMVYRFPSSRWRHWEKLPRRPEGFLVIGDAVCSFNPVYGQGMSSAGLQARALDTLLAHGVEDLPRRAAEAFATVVAVPWALATGGDRRSPGMPRKPLPERLLDRYLDRLLRVARTDQAVAGAFLRVLNLLAAPPSLLSPAVAWRVVRPRAARPVLAASRPGEVSVPVR